jgi:REP element-mobilizing transposase RayT
MDPSLNQGQPQPTQPVGAVRELPGHLKPTSPMDPSINQGQPQPTQPVGAVREPPGHDAKNPSRRSLRLQGHDYSQTGAYFITLCTRNRESLFGDIVDGSMRLNATGLIVAESWKWLATQYNHVELDEWVIMPNHLHGVIVITDDRRGGSRTARATRTTAPESQRKPIGGLIGAFKTISTKRINEYRSNMGSGIWQRNYYEHIIRNEPELSSIREYMQNNPMQWEMDSLFDNRSPY